jgi:UDP-N-acetylmuramoyl-L-alanyl-D-glutamate--2,6-diaminopimelate ligase
VTTLTRILERLARQGLLRGEQLPTGETAIWNVATDSREVEPGTLFCALAGTTADGHRFLPQVAERGAVAALVERPVVGVDLRQVPVADGRLAAAHAAGELWNDPWNELSLVGITGTNGKTTTAAILRHLLAQRAPAASIGTLGVIGADGEVVPGSEALTTPGPVDTARWLRRLADDAVTAVAMEVSSHALHQGRVAAARFDAAIFTNLSRDHLDYHHTLDAYRASKLRLLELLKPGAAAIVNAEDPAWAHVGAEQVVRFGGMGDVRAENLRAGAGGMEATLVVPDGRAALRIPLFGSYNVANTLAAAAALWTLCWTAEEIGAGLGTLPQVPGRLERVPGPAGVPAVLLDYAHTPDALERALAALRPLVRGELVVVFGAGGDRDPGKRTEMGRVAAAGADRVIVTSDNPRTEDPNAIADAIESGMGDAPRLRLLDRREAIRRAILDAGADDVVLLAGKGHETYQIWGTEKLPFDERVIVRALFAEIQGLS